MQKRESERQGIVASVVEKIRVAVMGCIVNGPGEGKHVDIRISLPGTSENPVVPVYIDGEKYATLRGDKVLESLIRIFEEYVDRRYSGHEK